MQVANYNLYKAHYSKNPSTAFPPIPLVPVTVPVDPHTLHMLCFTARYKPHTDVHIPEEDIQNTVAAIVDAAQLLDRDLHVREIQRAQQIRSGRATRRYFLKRNGSYGGARQLKFSLSTRCQHQEEALDDDTGICTAVFANRKQSGTCSR